MTSFDASSFDINSFDSDSFDIEAGEAAVIADPLAISNANATQDTGNRYTICQRSGMKAKPGSLVQEHYTGLWVLPEFADHFPDQLLVRNRAEDLRGAQRPEREDVFITTTVTPESL
jgi:hypothetical protein